MGRRRGIRRRDEPHRGVTRTGGADEPALVRNAVESPAARGGHRRARRARARPGHAGRRRQHVCESRAAATSRARRRRRHAQHHEIPGRSQ